MKTYVCHGCGTTEPEKVVLQERRMTHLPDGWGQVSLTTLRTRNVVLCPGCTLSLVEFLDGGIQSATTITEADDEQPTATT